MDQSSSLVSIGIPTYNRPEELGRTLEAIIGQTYQNLEIIVSDNATPGDSVATLLHEFMLRDSRISYFRQPENLGALFNFQFVLDKSNGEYFMWAADDDYRASTFVEALVEQMRLNPDCVLSFCDFEEVDSKGIKAEGYLPHFPLLQAFSAKNSFFRLLRFFFQLETKGKANLIYGLIKRDTLKNFKWEQFAQKHGSNGIDMLFVFTLLRQGRLALTEKLLYRCTVGNTKEYAPVVKLSFGAKLVVPFAGLYKLLFYSLQYLMIAEGWVFMALVMCWPIKVIDIIIRIFLVTEARNFHKRIKRLFTTVSLY